MKFELYLSLRLINLLINFFAETVASFCTKLSEPVTVRNENFIGFKFRFFIVLSMDIIYESWLPWYCSNDILYNILIFKACVRYFLWKFYFSLNDSPLKTMKNVFYFIWKALFVLEIFRFSYFHLPLFSPLSAIALEVDWRYILKFTTSLTVQIRT